MVQKSSSNPQVSENMKLAALSVSLVEILADCSIELDGDRGAQQFACPLHGDGHDERGSARYYADTNTAKCWGCDQLYDPIGWVQAYHGLSYPEAVEMLCRDYAGVEIDDETKRPIRPDDVVGRTVIATFEVDARRLQPKMSLRERIVLSQTLDRLWAGGCTPESQQAVETFFTKTRSRSAAARQ